MLHASNGCKAEPETSALAAFAVMCLAVNINCLFNLNLWHLITVTADSKLNRPKQNNQLSGNICASMQKKGQNKYLRF